MIVDLKLLSPLSHGAFDAGPDGNVMPLRRFPVMLDGQVVEVPAVSGNALRGRLRRIIMRDFLRLIGLGPDDPQWDWIYTHAVNGGALSGSADTTVDPARIRRVRTNVPPLSVFGAALGSWFLPGRVSVGICWPVCDVTVKAGVVTGGGPEPTLADIEGDVQHVRLPDRDVAIHQDIKPMPHGTETLTAGVILRTSILFHREATDVEQAIIVSAVSRLDMLGGNNARGLGRVEPVLADPDSSAAYAEWLEDAENTAVAVDALRELAGGAK